MKQLIILLSLISIFASGCVTRKACNRKFPAETMIIRKDSIIRETQTIYRDTTIKIYIPGETKTNTVTIYIKDEQIKVEPSLIKTTFAESSAYIENNELKHTLTQNDTAITYRIDNAIRVTWERANRYFKQDETRIVTKYHVPLLFKILSAIGIAGLIYLVFQLRKFFKL